MNEKKSELKSICNAAVELEHSERRRAFLDQACGDDSELRRQVDDLLAAAEMAGSFMSVPVLGRSDSDSDRSKDQDVSTSPHPTIGPISNPLHFARPS